MKNKRSVLPDTFGASAIKKSRLSKKFNLPYIGYESYILPDYFALYSNLNEYKKTKNTCVVFYEYDEKFDSSRGLWSAIIHNDKKKLEEFKKRFSKVKFIVAPDYSITGDMPFPLQLFQIYKSRVVSIWIQENCGCSIIPNLQFVDKRTYRFCFDGIHKNSVVCLSIYGLCKNPKDVENLKVGLRRALKIIDFETLLVYGECSQEKFKYIFEEVITNGVKIIFPNSRLKEFRRRENVNSL